MGQFLDTIKKSMIAKRLRQVDFTSKQCSQPTMAAIFRGVIPHKEAIITHIANVIGEDPKELKIKAAVDAIEDKVLSNYNLQWADIVKEQTHSIIDLPVYSLSNFKTAPIKKNGAPVIDPAFKITVADTSLENCFAIHIDSNELCPRVVENEIIVVSISPMQSTYGEHCLIRTASGEIHLGKALSNQLMLTIAEIPYQLLSFNYKDIAYIYHIRQIINTTPLKIETEIDILPALKKRGFPKAVKRLPK